VVVGEVAVFALSSEMDFRTGLKGSCTSLPGWNKPRRSCQVGEDMVVVVVVVDYPDRLLLYGRHSRGQRTGDFSGALKV
jgi:hypothetical protein